MTDRPPCWPEGTQCPNSCAAERQKRIVLNHTSLHGPWTGWRMAGQRLVSPAKEWVAPHQLDRWLWRHMRIYDY